MAGGYMEKKVDLNQKNNLYDFTGYYLLQWGGVLEDIF